MYKILFVGFDPEKQQDVLFEADFGLNYFDSKYVLPYMLKFIDQDFDMRLLSHQVANKELIFC